MEVVNAKTVQKDDVSSQERSSARQLVKLLCLGGLLYPRWTDLNRGGSIDLNSIQLPNQL